MRRKINFNTRWLYLAEARKECEQIQAAETGFQAVCLPHANTLLTRHKGPDFQEQIESYRFVSWYRRHFSLDKSFKNQRIFVEFEGVATVAQVYVNGQFVMEHKGAYTGFTVDITRYLLPCGEENVLAVRVDSTKHTDIPPEGNQVDYCLFGGIVRNVWMIATADCMITDTFSSTPNLAAGDTTVEHQVTLNNAANEKKELLIEILLADKDGNYLVVNRKEIRLNAGAASTSHLSIDVKNPVFWEPEQPYLYTVITRLYESGICIDEVHTQFGFRFFSFVKDGFYLNGKKMKLIGVNRHEQWPYLGRAVNDRHQKADADLIKDTGFNIVRCSHYPQAPAFLNRCDEIGLLVFEEAPGWQHIGDDAWKSIYMKNLEEMILRDRNHPSIISWGTRVNESFDDDAFYEKTNVLAKSLDGTRPTHGVRRMESYGNTKFLDGEDIYTINYQYPEKPEFMPFLITEHSMDWFEGNGYSWAKDTKALAFTKTFANVVDYYFGNPYCLGGFAWSMFDYNNEVNYTRTENVFYSGMYDIFRIPKMSSYFYRSQKDVSVSPFVYIANYQVENPDNTVTVMSNCEEVALYQNDRFLAKAKPNLYLNLPHPLFEFKEIPFESGSLTAIGYVNGTEAVRHTRTTPGKAQKILLTPNDCAITADGSDFTAVKIALVDENGTILPYADNEISIEITGAGNFIGEQKFALEGGTGAFYVSSNYKQTGKITCHASAPDVEDGNCEIMVTAFTGLEI